MAAMAAILQDGRRRFFISLVARVLDHVESWGNPMELLFIVVVFFQPVHTFRITPAFLAVRVQPVT